MPVALPVSADPHVALPISADPHDHSLCIAREEGFDSDGSPCPYAFGSPQERWWLFGRVCKLEVIVAGWLPREPIERLDPLSGPVQE